MSRQRSTTGVCWDGNRLRLFRQAKNLSQARLAESLSVSSSYLSMLENGVRKPSEHLLRLLCLTHGLSQRWLDSGEGQMFLAFPNPVPVAGKAKGSRPLPYNRMLLKAVISQVVRMSSAAGGASISEGQAELILDLYEKATCRAASDEGLQARFIAG